MKIKKINKVQDQSGFQDVKVMTGPVSNTAVRRICEYLRGEVHTDKQLRTKMEIKYELDNSITKSRLIQHM